MRLVRTIFCRTVIIISLLFVSPTAGEVTIDPIGFSLGMEENDEAEVAIVLSNSGEDDIAFSIDYDLIVDEDERRMCPRRDDRGERIATFEAGGGGWAGLGWDGERMWGINYGNRSMIAMDMDGEVENIANLDFDGRVGMCWDGEAFWVCSYGGGQIFRVDNEGEVLRNIDPEGVNPTCVTWDGENLWFCEYRGGTSFIHMIDLDGETILTLDLADILHDWISCTWVPEHNNGHLWVLHNRGTLYQLNVEEDQIEVIQQTDLNLENNFGLEHDGENMWYPSTDGGNNWFVIDDGIEEFHMLEFDPEEGIIPGEDSEAVDLLIMSTEVETGVYNMLIEIELSEPQEERDDLEQSLIQISAVVTVGDPTFDITGTITDEAEGAPIENVSIELDQYIITRFTDNEGSYSFTDLPPGDYIVTFTVTDYLSTIEEITIEEEDIELDVALLHSRCVPSPDNIEYDLEPDLTQDLDLTVTNTGNGPLTYMVERRLLGGADDDPWTNRFNVDAEEATGDNQLNGVAVVDGLMYVSGGDGGENTNLIHVFDQEGELVGQFDHFAESRYGMRDLTWDENLIWGADDLTLYGFNTDGELIETIEGEARSYRCLAWDKDRGWFWSADVTSDIFATDPESGEVVETIDRDIDTRTYGLSYWSDDPDGYCLYIFTRGDREEIDCQVNKMNVETGEMVMVVELEGVEGRPGGIDLTNQYDVYSYVLAGIVQSPDRVMVWQIDARRDWFLIDPTEGQIAAGAEQAFVVTLNAIGLPVDNIFRGELLFIHDGVGGETVIPVTLRVVEGEVWTTRELDLQLGWNTVSVNLQPDSTDVEYLMQPLVEADLLEIMKDDEGHFYAPAFGHNDIEGWFVQEGYQLKMSGEATLELQGISVMRDHPIDLHEGWQLISYYPNFPVEATLALSRIVEHLIICKDGYGNFYIPEWDFSNIGDMIRGQGYYLKMDAEAELRYTTVAEERMATATAAATDAADAAESPHSAVFPTHVNTGRNMSLLVVERPPLSPPLQVGGESNLPPMLSRRGIKGGVDIGVYAGDRMVSSGVLQDGVCGIAVWGDDPTTEDLDGALEGQMLKLKMLVDGELMDVDVKVLSGKLVYETDALAVVELSIDAVIPTDFAITSAYPNPFNSVLLVDYVLPEVEYVKFTVYDLTGRVVMELVKGELTAGMHRVILDGSALSSGLYFVRLETLGQMTTRKVMLIR